MRYLVGLLVLLMCLLFPLPGQAQAQALVRREPAARGQVRLSAPPSPAPPVAVPASLEAPWHSAGLLPRRPFPPFLQIGVARGVKVRVSWGRGSPAPRAFAGLVVGF